MIEPKDWALTQREADAVDALCEHGRVQVAAQALGISQNTFYTYLKHAMQKADTNSKVSLVLAWDRYSRPVPKGAAA